MSAQARWFSTGRILATPGAMSSIGKDEMVTALRRHIQGDWGEVCPADWHSNDDAIRHGLRLLSAYRTAKRQKFWSITEADRSATTILLPEEY